MNLTLLILVPLITAVAVLLMRNKQQVKWIALAGATVQLALALVLLFAYRNEVASGDNAQFLFQQQYEWFPSWHISLHLGVDGISVAMVLLTAFVVIAGVLVSWNIETMTKEFYFLLILLSFGAYGFFLSLDLFILFFFLEIAVIPKYLLIGIWGSGKKEYAANKLALMLMGGSALVLVGLLGLYFSNAERTFDLVKLSQLDIPVHIQLICFPLLFVGFGVFTALFPFHTWVPDGHSSAPTAGSMFLAGISMKLGGYGCLRVAAYVMPEGAKEYANIIIVLSTIAILYGAFAAIGMIYERTHTRQVNEMGGLLKVMPFITTVLFIVGLCSLGLPGLSGFV